MGYGLLFPVPEKGVGGPDTIDHFVAQFQLLDVCSVGDLFEVQPRVRPSEIYVGFSFGDSLNIGATISPLGNVLAHLNYSSLKFVHTIMKLFIAF